MRTHLILKTCRKREITYILFKYLGVGLENHSHSHRHRHRHSHKHDAIGIASVSE